MTRITTLTTVLALTLSSSTALAQEPARPASVEVTPAAIRLGVGETGKLSARGLDAQGRAIAGAIVRWFTANPEVAVVDGETGVVTAVRPGEARVAALVNGVAAFATVTVEQLPPASIELTMPGGDVQAGASAPLAVAVRTRLGDLLPDAAVTFTSSDEAVARVDATGRVYGRRPGQVVIRATAGGARAETRVRVVENPAASYELSATATTARTGDVIRLRVRGRARDGREVAGFRPQWSVSGVGAQVEAEGEEGVFVAERPGRYAVTALIGEGRAETVVLDITERGPRGRLIKVGRGPASTHHSADTWVFTGVDGRDYAIVGTFMYDWAKVWDVTDPTAPVLTDSIQLDARRINDVKIHPNNRLGVLTREGASNRRNGIVILDLSTPAHPKILSEYTATVTGGVHNVWITANPDLVYACHNGTSDLHIIDISDPTRPREVGRWGLDREFKTLHDVIVQDGYAYLSYWDDGVVILDVGAGTHGGTPTRPAFVSRYSYPEGNTHVAWRHGRYLFVGDEIFPDDWDADRPIEARGYIHVLDVTDIENPREVAKYEVPEAGVHNVWAEGDLLYVGYYQGGLRVVDISGELRGDLYRQGRELAVLKTTDEHTMVPNWPMTWGAQLFKGHIFTSDLNSGLWIAKFERPEVVF